MKFPFVKAKTASSLQQKLDDTRQKLEAARKELGTLKKEVNAARKRLGKNKGVGPMIDEGRAFMSIRFLRGKGLEIGALHRPTPTADGVVTKYYDYLSAEDNLARCPELAADGNELVHVDYVGDGEKLELIPDDSLDHLIANHMLEHCQDVISTLKVFMSKLKQGGHLFITLPDKRYSFDFNRPITPYEHLVKDHQEGPAQSLYDHYLDVHRHNAIKGVGSNTMTKELLTREEVHALPHLDIHFHVWTQFDMLEMFMRLKADFGFLWEFEGLLRNGHEVIMVLKKEEVEVWDRAEPDSKAVRQER
ncbi:methyltransferase domain-containing protein [Verrucomicrobium sp. BvORR034]|uniref:methyltransferase domain-containing protein n=1 Tax=Verrucomicrobium sp. BvORR034 TaxID=1396418 RepID=UPI0006789983|nr:methyltransferase domain-containing protein [Verrucomicrobium sp. BvORR034]